MSHCCCVELCDESKGGLVGNNGVGFFEIKSQEALKCKSAGGSARRVKLIYCVQLRCDFAKTLRTVTSRP